MISDRTTWLFDLDNTLHNANAFIFPRIHQLMMDYMCRELGVGKEAAIALRRRYLRRYGATLLGMMRHHGTNPRHFLAHTHDLPDLQRMVVCERGLSRVLARLPGRKLLFTNAPAAYTHAVLSACRIHRCFDGIYSIEDFRFSPKPALTGYLHILRREQLRAPDCIMVEDTLRNLRTAKRLGMRTVWVTNAPDGDRRVDVQVSSVLDLPRRIRRL